MPEQTQLQDVNNSAEAAAYIADLSLDLAQIARRHGLDASVSSWTWRTSKRRR
jgi:hypothetical protein